LNKFIRGDCGGNFKGAKRNFDTMENNMKCYVVDFYLDGYYLKSKSLFQENKIEIGEVINIELPENKSNVTGKVVDIFDMSEDEYHLYISSI
jgi:hypothetical protein